MLELRNITKAFGGFAALRNVSITVRTGEVVGLVGENGAGKSTLMKVLHGIGMVYQEQSLIPSLIVAENLFLGNEARFTRRGRIDWPAMKAAAARILSQVELDIDPFTPTAELSYMHRQMVEIAKVLTLQGMVEGDLCILLDEPASVLEQEEIGILFGLVRKLRARAGIIFVPSPRRGDRDLGSHLCAQGRRGGA